MNDKPFSGWLTHFLINTQLTWAASVCPLIIHFNLLFIWLTSGSFPANVLSFSCTQGEEGDQGAPGEVGAQGPMVRNYVHEMLLESCKLQFALYCVRLSFFCSPKHLLDVFVISGSSGSPRSHRNDGPQRRDGKQFHNFYKHGTFQLHQTLHELLANSGWNPLIAV